jgi:hypothetical protein
MRQSRGRYSRAGIDLQDKKRRMRRKIHCSACENIPQDHSPNRILLRPGRSGNGRRDALERTREGLPARCTRDYQG